MTSPLAVPERFNAADFFLDRHLREGRGARTAFRYEGRRVTYATLGERANRLGNALRARGVDIEQRVLLVLPDCPEFAESFWGAVKIGAVPVPVNDGLSPADYAFLLGDSRARAVVASAAAAQKVLAAGVAGAAIAVVARGGDGSPALRPEPLDYEALLDGASAELEAADTSRDDTAMWGYTSGSTGQPKAAVHLHRDLVCSSQLVGQGIFGIRPDDLVLSVSKLHFAFGLGNALYFPAQVGAASLLVPGRPEPATFLELIQAERPTLLFAVPTVYARLLQVEGRFDLSSLRVCVSSGESLPAALFRAWRARFGLELLDVVGSTEALHDFIANRPGRARAGASGQIVPGYEARLVDEEGRPVPAGTVGHLLVKGDSTAPGYWNRREATKATMLGEWLRTGDMFYQDGDGYFYFCGRSDDMLKVNGMWVAPAEVEACLVEHPAVLEAAVVAGEDGDGLARPRAFCVLKPGGVAGEALAAELRERVRSRLAPHKTPRWVEFVDELPKTSTGKIQRFRLRRGD